MRATLGISILRNSYIALAWLCLSAATPAFCATWYVATNGNDLNPGTAGEPFLTIQKGVDSAFAGDTVLLGAGDYHEDITSERSGTLANRIVIDGQNAAAFSSLSLSHQCLTLQNVTLTDTTPGKFFMVMLNKGAHYTVLSNDVFDVNYKQGQGYVLRWAQPYPGELPFGTNCASGCLIISNTIQGLPGSSAIYMFGETNIICGNLCRNGDSADWIYPWGKGHQIIGNVFSNNYTSGFINNHSDWLQVFDNNGHGASNIVFERNLVVGFTGETQLGMPGTFTWIISDLIFRNNIFARCSLAFKAQGIKNLQFYNNTFYECTNAGAAILSGPSFFNQFNSFDPQFCPKYELLTNEIHSGEILDDAIQPLDERAQYIVKGGVINYNGTNFGNNATFLGAAGVTTFSTVSGDPIVWRELPFCADGVRIVNNVFLNCGGGDTNGGWYEVYEGSTNLLADYNFVSIFDSVPRLDELSRPVGNAGGWSRKQWYETNGLAGGDPRFTDPDNLDMVPQTNSALLGAGLDLSAYFTNDYYGNYRSNSWTIGAVQNSRYSYGSIFASKPHFYYFKERICKPITNAMFTNIQFYLSQGGDTNNEVTYGITQDSNWVAFSFTNGSVTAERDTNTAWLTDPFFAYATNWPTWSAGSYTSHIIINGYTNSVLCNTRTIPITLTLTNPLLKSTKSSFTITCANGVDAASTNYSVYTSDRETVFTYTNKASASWIVSQTNGVVSTVSNRIDVSFDTDGLATDDYTGYITNVGCGLSSFCNTQVITVNLSVTDASTAPVITSEPEDRSIYAGNSTTFSISASGTNPKTYQWKRDGASISGATNSSFTTNRVGLGAHGSVWTCAITNAVGGVISTGATLNVTVYKEQLMCLIESEAVMPYSIADTNCIIIVWPTNQYRQQIVISRRDYTNDPAEWNEWVPLVTNTANITSEGEYCDVSVSSGKHYEYKLAVLTTNYVCSGSTNPAMWTYAYINTGTLVPVNDTRGNVVLLIESNIAASISSEIQTLTNDLIGDGWIVFQHLVAACDVSDDGWEAAVADTKELVRSDYETDTNANWTLFIIGHVPIPYSGESSPGGHAENTGAHVADWYYADLSAVWTDSSVDNESATNIYSHTWNVPGDGKFDQSTVPSIPEFRVGRIDFTNMPAFGKTEVQLLQQYLNRNHQWRHKQFTARDLGVTTYSYHGVPIDGPSIMSAVFGPGQVNVSNAWLYVATNAANSFLLADKSGNGNYNFDMSQNFVTNYTTNFAASSLYAVFTSMYGSYYGDWDSGMHSNQVLLAPLCSTGYVLSTVYHSSYMAANAVAMNETIGDELFILAANVPQGVVDAAYAKYQQVGGSIVYGALNNYQSLLGDPTLRMRVVAPPTNAVMSTNGSDVAIAWTASTDTNIQGYYVYRAPSSNLNSFARLTANPTISPYTNTGGATSAYTYMVRAVKLEEYPMRTFYNASQGIFAGGAGEEEPPAAATNVINAVELRGTQTWRGNVRFQ